MLFVHCIKRYSKFGVLKLILKDVQTLREGKWATEVEVKAASTYLRTTAHPHLYSSSIKVSLANCFSAIYKGVSSITSPSERTYSSLSKAFRTWQHWRHAHIMIA